MWSVLIDASEKNTNWELRIDISRFLTDVLTQTSDPSWDKPADMILFEYEKFRTSQSSTGSDSDSGTDLCYYIEFYVLHKRYE